jgi:hypothetical protein
MENGHAVAVLTTQQSGSDRAEDLQGQDTQCGGVM